MKLLIQGAVLRIRRFGGRYENFLAYPFIYIKGSSGLGAKLGPTSSQEGRVQLCID